MLNQEIAQRFIDRLDRVLDFNINIMDNRGIIIASRDPLRIGTFHEVAREVLVKGLSGLSVSRDEILPPGVRPGINLPVVLDGNPEGVIGVTGDAPELANVAAALKSSLETMLEYERQQADAVARQRREIESTQAREFSTAQEIKSQEHAKAELARLESEQQVAVRAINKQREEEVATKNRERVLVVETETVEKERALQVIARERETDLQRYAKDKELENKFLRSGVIE